MVIDDFDDVIQRSVDAGVEKVSEDVPYTAVYGYQYGITDHNHGW